MDALGRAIRARSLLLGEEKSWRVRNYRRVLKTWERYLIPIRIISVRSQIVSPDGENIAERRNTKAAERRWRKNHECNITDKIQRARDIAGRCSDSAGRCGRAGCLDHHQDQA